MHDGSYKEGNRRLSMNDDKDGEQEDLPIQADWLPEWKAVWVGQRQVSPMPLF